MKDQVKEKLARGELVASMIVRLVPGVEIVSIAKAADFDSMDEIVGVDGVGLVLIGTNERTIAACRTDLGEGLAIVKER